MAEEIPRDREHTARADGRAGDAAGTNLHADFSAEDLEPRPIELPPRHRVLTVVALLAGIALLAFVPPLINVGRYRKQIASSIGTSMGRPVRLDSVTLSLLPLPGFTLQNFVVGEDPAFGAEPVLRANQVKATLRVGSLWRRRMEFSRIALEDPSVNLVHLPDGRWNLESILVQASRVHAAPTVQKDAGDAPRFPYIEATGARVNLKMGLEKMPLALTDAAFALWQPEPDRWRLRLEAHPARTDTASADSGLLRIEGTLGRADRLADVPIDLGATWSVAPLGAVSLIALGRDAGLRGELTLQGSARGTVGDNALAMRVQVQRFRRAEFVPDRTLGMDLRCTAQATGNFHRLDLLHCTWPAEDDGHGLELKGTVPDLMHPTDGTYTATLTGVPTQSLIDSLHVASARVPPGLAASGLLSGSLACCGSHAGLPEGTVELTGASLTTPDLPAFKGGPVSASLAGGRLTLARFPLDLGGGTPAVLEGQADGMGYTLHLSGAALPSRVLALAHALPQFGDGLAELLPKPAAPESLVHLDLTSQRTWQGGQDWAASAPTRPPARRPRRRRAE